MGKSFFVKTNCTGCYNVIYNGQALALYKQADEILRLKPGNIRLDFSKESADETKKILELFINRFRYNRMLSGELTDYTTGHFKRGVE
jgi:putative protease